MSVEYVVARSPGFTGRGTRGGCSDGSPPNTCGTQQNDAAASEKGFGVFSFGNAWSVGIGDFQIIRAQYVRLAW